MSDAFEEFVSQFEAMAPAVRLRAMDLILALPDSDEPLDLDADPDEFAAKAGIDQKQIERFKRAIAEVNAWRVAQNH